MRYIVYNRATGDRITRTPVSRARAEAVTNSLNYSAGYRQYAYRPVGIFDSEFGEEGWLLFAAIVSVAFFIWLGLTHGAEIIAYLRGE